MTMPSIPDNYYKFCLYLSLIIFAFLYTVQYERLRSSVTSMPNQILSLDSLQVKLKYKKKELTQLEKKLDSGQDSVEVMMREIEVDTAKLDNKIILKNAQLKYKKTKEVHKRNQALLKDLNTLEDEVNFISTNISITDYHNKQSYNFFRINLLSYASMLLIAGVSLLIGISGIQKHQKQQDLVLKSQSSNLIVSSTYCESCGKNFNPIIIHGTNEDGTKSNHFCQWCYDKGKFVEVELTQQTVLDRIIQKNSPSPQELKKITKRIMALERWKKDSYT